MARQQRIELFGKVTPTGVDQTAGAKYAQVAQLAREISSTAQGIAEERAIKQGREEGALTEVRDEEGNLKAPELTAGLTLRGQARNAAAITAYKGEVTRDAKLKFQQLFQDHQNEPEVFNAKMQGYLNGLAKGVDPEIMVEIKPVINEYAAATIGKAQALEFAKAQEATLASLSASEEDFTDDILNAARAGDTDSIAVATKQLRDTFDAMVMAKHITPEERVKKEETLREQIFIESTIGSASKIVNSALSPSEKLEELDKIRSEAFSEDLNASQNEALKSGIEKFKNTVIAEETRKQSLNKAHNKAEIRSLKDRIAKTKKALESGINIDDTAIADLIGRAQEINALTGEDSIDIGELVSDYVRSEKISIFAKETPAAQEAIISKLRNLEQSQGLSPEQAEEFSAALKAQEKVKRELKKDALLFYEAQGFTELEPLNIVDENGQFSGAAFRESLAKRALVSQEASAHYGQPVSPMTELEVQSFSGLIQELPHDAQAEVIGSMVSSLGDSSVSVFEQMSKNGGTVLAWSGGVASAGGDPTHILRGRELLRENKTLLPDGKDFDRYALEQIQGAYQNPSAAMAAITAAKNAYASLAHNAGLFDGIMDDDLADEALRIATGGIVEYNDKKIPAPIYGMANDDFEDFMENFQPHYFDKFGTDTLPPGITKERLAEMISDSEVDLVDRGMGKYYIRANDNFVQNNKGEPYILNLKAIIE